MQKKLITDPLTWGNVQLRNRLILAPMAGPGSLAFRRLADRLGAGLTVTELCSARGITYDPGFHKSQRYLNMEGLEQPAFIQLFGSDPDDFQKAVSLVLENPHYAACGGIDINMGCPVTKVVKTGAGSALMRTPDLAAKIVERAVKAAQPFGKTVTVKIRAGWDQHSINAPAFATRMENAGAAAITLHARTRDQFYQGKANWSLFKLCGQMLTVPFAANGDIQTLDDCRTLLAETGVSACMIGRAALGRPWIFQALLCEAAGESFVEPRGETWAQLVWQHYSLLAEERGETAAIKEFRSSLAYYIKGFPGAATWRSRLFAIERAEELRAALRQLAVSHT